MVALRTSRRMSYGAVTRRVRQQWVRLRRGARRRLAFAHQLDDDTREHFGDGDVFAARQHSPDTARRSRRGACSARASSGTWLAAVLADEDEGRREAGAMLVVGCVLGGRGCVTPKQDRGPRTARTPRRDSGDWGGDGEAFPSVHTTAALRHRHGARRVGQRRLRWLRRTLGYGLAVGTAYARMDHDAHWLLDTVAGAGLGIATARFVMKRREERDSRARFEVPSSRPTESPSATRWICAAKALSPAAGRTRTPRPRVSAARLAMSTGAAPRNPSQP